MGKTYYRADIDGMRAIAVIGVILFHIWDTSLTGGFLGVDMFFVISGFLITRNILRDVDKGTFEFSRFYARRIKRLFPAALVVVSVTSLFAFIVMLPVDLQEYTESAFFTLAQIANFFFAFMVDDGYFASSSSEKPLLHMWSLAVEEQFYLVWPLSLIILLKLKQVRLQLGVIISLAFVSIIHGELMIAGHGDFAYYMFTTRAAELLAGAGLAFGFARGMLWAPDNKAIASFISVSGLAFVFYSLVFMEETDGFPGLSILPIVIGTLLLIVAGRNTSHILTPVLANSVLGFIGLISYSLYLWHWPVLAFARYGFIDITIPTGLLLLGVIVMLSVLTYFLVEKPLRYGTLSLSLSVLSYSMVPLAVVTALFAFTVKTDGYMPLRDWDLLKPKLEKIQALKPANRYRDVLQPVRLKATDFRAARYLINKEGRTRPRVLLWGDSNAMQYVNFFKSFGQKVNFGFRNVGGSACPPIFGEIDELVSDKVEKDCATNRELVREEIKAFDTIILGGSWFFYNRRGDMLTPLEATIKELTEQGKSIIIMLQMQRMPGLNKDCGQRALLVAYINCADRFTFKGPVNYDVNLRLKALAKKYHNVTAFDINPWLCPDGECSAYWGNRLMYYDDDHIEYEAAGIIGAYMFDQVGVPEALTVLDQR